MRAYDVAFVGSLVFGFPELMPILQEHLDDYDGLIPHVLMGDVTRWVVQQFHTDAASSTLRQVLNFIEVAFECADSANKELIAASFLENMPRADGEDGGVRALLGPALQAQL